MKNILIADATLRFASMQKAAAPTFREKVALLRELDRLSIDVIEFPHAEKSRVDTLLLHTAAPIVKNAVISCKAELSESAIEAAWDSVKDAAHPRLLLEAPTSAVQMEYLLGCKPKALLERIPTLISYAASLCPEVEFSALDATRSEPDFLCDVLNAAIQAGAKVITVCDTAGSLLPDELSSFLSTLFEKVPILSEITLGVECSDKLHMGAACMLSAANAGAGMLKTSYCGDQLPPVNIFADVIRLRGEFLSLRTGLDLSVLAHTSQQVLSLLSSQQAVKSQFSYGVRDTLQSEFHLRSGDDQATVLSCVKALGYELSDEDAAHVFESVQMVSEKKVIGAKELDAIVASAAMQVPPTYRLRSYVTNSSNVMSASAQIELEKEGRLLQGISLGDGPIDAAFLAIERILGHHFELDDFQIQSVTEGREAMGEALVKLRSEGKLYAGRGISTDIIGASIRAYISALNKICYEEAGK